MAGSDFSPRRKDSLRRGLVFIRRKFVTQKIGWRDIQDHQQREHGVFKDLRCFECKIKLDLRHGI